MRPNRHDELPLIADHRNPRTHWTSKSACTDPRRQRKDAASKTCARLSRQPPNVRSPSFQFPPHRERGVSAALWVRRGKEGDSRRTQFPDRKSRTQDSTKSRPANLENHHPVVIQRPNPKTCARCPRRTQGGQPHSHLTPLASIAPLSHLTRHSIQGPKTEGTTRGTRQRQIAQ